MKIYEIDGRKVWLDPAKAPADAVPFGKKPEAKPEPEPVKEAPEVKAKPATANKAKKTPANKARKVGGNK